MPRRAGPRPAAYTRTRHLLRFLDLASHSLPPVLDAVYARERMGLSGGDVRAFLQSLRVLGLIDVAGHPTERMRRARTREGRHGALREGLREAYPGIVTAWEERGGLTREQVEDYFKLEFGLGATSAGPAAKLFLDLWSARGGPIDEPAVGEMASKGGEASSPNGDAALPARAAGAARAAIGGEGRASGDRGERIARILADLVRVEIGPDWDAERIRLVFEGLNGLIDRLAGRSGPDGGQR